MLAPLPDTALTAPLDDGWSVRDALAHLLDVEDVIAVDRIGRILREERPVHPLDRSRSPAWTDRGLRARSVASLLDELAARRPPDVAMLTALTKQQLARTGDHDEAGEITVRDLIHQWAYHDLMHTKQIASMLQSPLVAGMGNTRKFYDL